MQKPQLKQHTQGKRGQDTEQKLTDAKASIKRFFKCCEQGIHESMAYTKTENLLVSGRHRHLSENFALSWRCPRVMLGSRAPQKLEWGLPVQDWDGLGLYQTISWSSCLIQYFWCACKCASASQFQLWVASISLERRTFVLLCKCYPTVLAIGWRGEIIPLTALPPKIQLSKTLLGQRHSTENVRPRGECLARLWGNENKRDWIESDLWPQCQWLLLEPRAGIACDRLKAILLTPLTQINQRSWKFWFIDHIFLTRMYLLLYIRKHPYKWDIAKLELSDIYFCSQ